MKNLILLLSSAIFGAISGLLVVLSIISGFEEMILSSFMNIYYFTVYFIVGAYYTYKILKKNQIQKSLENDTLDVSGLNNQNINGMMREASTGSSSSTPHANQRDSMKSLASLNLFKNSPITVKRDPLVTEA